ncbi:MAG: hypothetical protein CBB68_11425 [Rhodospirillaceae bacterium TMED8]|nr:2-hydroxychromene-2-carboxylate isomerase [Magnetovibrio sp.]OUT49609.1 MAG: hypothetical protein CBB68_11425 [Rhodospirillaceae bacterium TMED8]
MVDSVQFYFDFSSPYSYFASFKINQTCESLGCQVEWKPILLGPLFNITGSAPLNTIPMKAEYCVNDWDRLARYMNVPWVLPKIFPIATQVAARTFYWLHERDHELALKFAKETFMTYFGHGQDISSSESVVGIAASLGVCDVELSFALSSETVKERVKYEVQAAQDVGVFGAPYFIVNGEGFWGSDRMWMIRRWIERDGW